MTKKKHLGSQTVKHGNQTGQSFTTRNLQPQDLGAVIFGCRYNTFAECHTRQLFGLPRAHLSYVKNIKEGLPLFLFNYDNRTLHGIYEAASDGMFCPQSNAWSHNGKERTPYPAQVAMRLKLWCIPLAENQFRNVILTNYYERMPGVLGPMRFFYFELDHAQTHDLMNMFTPLPSPYDLRTPHVAATVHEHVRKSTLQPVLPPELEGNCDVSSEKAVKPYVDAQKELEDVCYVGVNAEHAITTNECSNGFNDLDGGDTLLEGRDHALSNKDAKLQQQKSRQEDKRHSLEVEKLKMLCPRQHSSAYANAAATADIDTYSCKDAQEVKSTILDGPPDPDETFNADISLDFKFCADTKMMNTRCTDVNQLSPSLPAITQQFQETETQWVRAVYETPNNINDNGALEATDPAGHPQSCCADSTSIQPVSISSSQECMRVENSSTKGRKRKTPCCHDEMHNKNQNELPSPDYIDLYVKDKLTGNITCMVCGEQGHYTCHCPMKDQEDKVMCTQCNKVGHCYLWCCRQNVSENHACRRCGEKGHYTNKDLSHCDEKYTTMYIRCSSCDDSHPLGRCPMGKVTCFLCEGKDHIPAHCRLSPMLTVTQDYRQSFLSILKQALAETSRRADTPAKPSSKLEPHDDSRECQIKRNVEMVHTVSSIIPCEQGDSTRKNATKSVQDFNKTNHAVLKEKVLTRGSSFACFNCHEEGPYARSCHKKSHGELRPVWCGSEAAAPPITCSTQNEELNLGKETVADCGSFRSEANIPLEQHDVTYSKFRTKKKKKTANVICFCCHEKGHYSHNCPAIAKTVNKTPGGLELHDVTCINYDENMSDRKKPPVELLCDVTCFKCHDKGHYSYSCPKNEPPGQCHGAGHSAKMCSKKKQKEKQQK